MNAEDRESLPLLHAEFHSIIDRRCGSAKLIRWINELNNQFPKRLNQITRYEEPPLEYRCIVKAIVAGDGDSAGRLMSEHNEKDCQASIEYYIGILGK